MDGGNADIVHWLAAAPTAANGINLRGKNTQHFAILVAGLLYDLWW